MKRGRILIILGIIAAAGIVWAAFFRAEDSGLPPEPGSSSEERRIQAAIDEANLCETVADCALASVSACPFGCYIHVHKDEVARIEAMLDGFQSTCMYSCIEFPGVDCVSGKCELRQ